MILVTFSANNAHFCCLLIVHTTAESICFPEFLFLPADLYNLS